MRLDESPPSPPNNASSIKKSARGVNFSLDEDKLLVSAWLNSSIDAIQGTDKKYTQLWDQISEYFNQHKETTTERTAKSLIHRWSAIQKATSKFCEKVAQVRELNQSGMTEQDKLDKAKIMYQSLEKCNFLFEHCWLLLKDQPKWIMLPTKEKKKGHATRCSIPINDSAFTSEKENATENEVIELDRPMGRKAEKKRRAQGREAEEIIQLRKVKYTLLEESCAQEKEFYRLKFEKMDNDKKMETEKLRLEAEKIELAKKESDQRIMMMDVSAMTTMQRSYFEKLQEEIMLRTGHA